MNQISQDALDSLDNEQVQQVVLGALAKLTSRSKEELKPYVDELLARLTVEARDDLSRASFYETATHQEWIAEFRQWIDSHKGKDIPVLSEEAISRDSLYPDRW